MKLHLKNNPAEVFDAPRGIALALIAAGVAEEPKPKVVVREVRWVLCKGTLTENEYYIKVSCPTCHHNASIFGHVDGRVPPFRHCGGENECPEDISDQFFKYLAQRKPNKPSERETRPTNIFAVGLL
jgi:hypothetical protein